MRVDRLVLAASVVAGLALAGESLGYVLHNANWAWHNLPVEEPFDLNTASFPNNFAGGTANDIENAFVGALDRWTIESGADLVLTYGGRRNTNSWSNDSYNIAQYHQGPNGTALAVAQYWSSNGNIRDCDIRFYGSNVNGPTNWSTNPNGAAKGRQDFERTATHELGHCIGVNHSDVKGAIMYPSQSSGSGVPERALRADDKAAAQAIYGVAAAPPPPPPPPPTDAELVITGFQLTEVGDGDGRFEPNERVLVTFTVDNLAAVDAEDVEAVTGTADADVTVLTALSVPSMGPDVLAASSDDLVGAEIAIGETCRADRTVDFEVIVDADNAPAAAFAFEIDVACGIALDASEDWRVGKPAWVELTGALPGEEIRFERTIGTPGRARCIPRPGIRCEEETPGRTVQLVVADADGVARWDFVIPAWTKQNTQMWVTATATRANGSVILKADPVGRRVRR